MDFTDAELAEIRAAIYTARLNYGETSRMSEIYFRIDQHLNPELYLDDGDPSDETI